jgi:hypothetical protein
MRDNAIARGRRPKLKPINKQRLGPLWAGVSFLVNWGRPVHWPCVFAGSGIHPLLLSTAMSFASTNTFGNICAVSFRAPLRPLGCRSTTQQGGTFNEG